MVYMFSTDLWVLVLWTKVTLSWEWLSKGLNDKLFNMSNGMLSVLQLGVPALTGRSVGADTKRVPLEIEVRINISTFL